MILPEGSRGQMGSSPETVCCGSNVTPSTPKVPVLEAESSGAHAAGIWRSGFRDVVRIQ